MWPVMDELAGEDLEAPTQQSSFWPCSRWQEHMHPPSHIALDSARAVCFAPEHPKGRMAPGSLLTVPCVAQVQILLQKRGLSLNPITTLYYIAPASFVCLLLPWAIFEARPLMADPTVHIDIPIFVSNAAGG